MNCGCHLSAAISIAMSKPGRALNSLDRTTRMPTWIAYVVSEKPTGPLSAISLASSPHIKKAITVMAPGLETENPLPAYHPLRICRGIFATEFDRQGGREYTGISMPLHAAVAGFMGEINPALRYMGVFPLETMR